jgi:hypothetical protein
MDVPDPPSCNGMTGSAKRTFARSAISAKCQELTLASQSEIPVTHSNRLAGEDDPCFQRNAPVQVLDVVVHQSDASGSDEMPDSFWRIRAVNE